MSRAIITGEPFAQVPASIVLHEGLSDGAKNLWAVLYLKAFSGAFETGAFDSFAVSHSELARVAHCGVSTVKRHVEELQGAGVVAVEHTTGSRGKQPNTYRLVTAGPFGQVETDPTQDGSELTHPSFLPITNTLVATPPRTPRKRDPDLIFEAIATGCGIRWQKPNRSPASELGRVSKAAKELREVGATPRRVAAACDAYRRLYTGASLTPQALTNNWSLCDTGEGESIDASGTSITPEYVQRGPGRMERNGRMD